MYDLSLRLSFNLLGFGIICIQLYVNCSCFLMRAASPEVHQARSSLAGCGRHFLGSSLGRYQRERERERERENVVQHPDHSRCPWEQPKIL